MIAERNAFSQHPVEFAVLTNCFNATIMIAVMIFSRSAMIDGGKGLCLRTERTEIT